MKQLRRGERPLLAKDAACLSVAEQVRAADMMVMAHFSAADAAKEALRPICASLAVAVKSRRDTMSYL